jgi:hypothetical protein
MTNKYIGEKNPPVFMYRWNWVSVMTQWYFRYSNPLLSPYHVSSTYLNIFYLLLIKIIIALRLIKKEKYAN